MPGSWAAASTRAPRGGGWAPGGVPSPHRPRHLPLLPPHPPPVPRLRPGLAARPGPSGASPGVGAPRSARAAAGREDAEGVGGGGNGRRPRGDWPRPRSSRPAARPARAGWGGPRPAGCGLRLRGRTGPAGHTPRLPRPPPRPGPATCGKREELAAGAGAASRGTTEARRKRGAGETGPGETPSTRSGPLPREWASGPPRQPPSHHGSPPSTETLRRS